RRPGGTLSLRGRVGDDRALLPVRGHPAPRPPRRALRPSRELAVGASRGSPSQRDRAPPGRGEPRHARTAAVDGAARRGGGLSAGPDAAPQRERTRVPGACPVARAPDRVARRDRSWGASRSITGPVKAVPVREPWAMAWKNAPAMSSSPAAAGWTWSTNRLGGLPAERKAISTSASGTPSSRARARTWTLAASTQS